MAAAVTNPAGIGREGAGRWCDLVRSSLPLRRTAGTIVARLLGTLPSAVS
jgi:hypothetical protein